jgi:hypothetical protein
MAAAFAAALTVGCGDSEPKPATRSVAGPPEQVARVVKRLESAVRARDFQTVCNALLTPPARRRAGGSGCAKTMHESVADLRRPRITLLSIRIDRRRAEARVRTRATGQAPVTETLQLERSGQRYRISALAR